MTLTLAALGAVLVALLEASISPYLTIGGGHPHLVLVIAIVWTIVAGLDGGLVWAFVGGLALDFLTPRPLGSSAFVLLLAVGGALVIGRLFAQVRLRSVAPVAAVLVLSPLYSLLLLVVYGALAGPLDVGNPIAPLLPGIVFDTAVAAVLAPLALAIRMRVTEQERLDW